MSAFKGWHSRGYLPHFDSPETIQFVTFRLADSLPLERIEALRSMPDAMRLLDRELDTRLGECWLRDADVAALTQDSLLHFDGQRYRLLAWCIMPNHVHVVVEPMSGHTLSVIVKSWQSFTSRQANQHLGQTGAFWEADYFDRYMRNEDQLQRTIEYVENNQSRLALSTKHPTGHGARHQLERGPPGPLTTHERTWRSALRLNVCP